MNTATVQTEETKPEEPTALSLLDKENQQLRKDNEVLRGTINDLKDNTVDLIVAHRAYQQAVKNWAAKYTVPGLVKMIKQEEESFEALAKKITKPEEAAAS